MKKKPPDINKQLDYHSRASEEARRGLALIKEGKRKEALAHMRKAEQLAYEYKRWGGRASI